MALVIEDQTDLSVERQFNLGGTMICHNALVRGEIDIYAEYTGTALTAVLHQNVVPSSDEAYKTVKAEYREKYACEWLEPFGFSNTYTITVRRSDAESYDWHTISDLIPIANQLKAGFTAEFAERPDGYPGLSTTYGIIFKESLDLDPGLMYKAIAQREVDVICAFSTDGRIITYDLFPLEDDRHFFPPYQAAPVVRTNLLETYPDVRKALRSLGGILDNMTMQRLNYEVDEKKRSVAEIAFEFLKDREPYIR